MKQVMRLVVIGSAAFLAVSPVAFAVSHGPVDVSAEVGGDLLLSVVLHKNNSTGFITTSMDFGVLEDIGSHTLRSSPTGSTGTGNISAVIFANSHGAHYTIKQTGTSLQNGDGVILPTGACTVVPVYAP